jgi:hypothetical protein
MAIATPIAMQTSPMLNTFASGTPCGTAKTSPRTSRRGCGITAEFRKSVELVSLPAVRRALRDAGMTPLFARIAIRFSVAPSASTRIPARRRFATTKTAARAYDPMWRTRWSQWLPPGTTETIAI